MHAFIIRPFGTKQGIDFDQVEGDLIRPALEHLAQFGYRMSWGTTGKITRQGNIREDMFRLIVASDLVIADVSIHNANVFYELGIRHALRPQHTFLVRSKTSDAYPFDLQTERYLLYDAADPGANVAALAEALRSTLASEERDSPVFILLPKLLPHGRGELVQVPHEFREAVEQACRAGQVGDLRLLAFEAASFEWEQEGLRLIGEAQFKLHAFACARETFEALRAVVPNDVQVNLRLGTVYQRLALAEPAQHKDSLFVHSDQAIRRVLNEGRNICDQVEAYSLLGSNGKSRWMKDFSTDVSSNCEVRALRSPHLDYTINQYLHATDLDLNAHYPGVNALALLRIQIALAYRMPEIWAEVSDDDSKAESLLKSRETLASRLTSSLCLALKIDEVMGSHNHENDRWLASSRADFLLLTTCDQPKRVAREYRNAHADSDRFTLEATRRNLTIYKDLNVFEPGVSSALQIVDDAIKDRGHFHGKIKASTQVILFTGHMVDTPDRKEAEVRFPRTPQAAAKARHMIEEAVRKEMLGYAGTTLGLAGGACGGDIIFHEVCKQLDTKTELFLALPEDQFLVTSVQHGGIEWIERYRVLIASRLPRILQQSTTLPRWLSEKSGYNIWQRTNLWMMFNAIATKSRYLTLIALHNPDDSGSESGGTRHLLEEAKKWGFKTVELDARELLRESCL